MKRQIKLTILGMAFALLQPMAHAQGITWDQQNSTAVFFPGTYFNLPFIGPTGQQFIPNLASLDTVGVVLNSGGSLTGGIQIFIHEGSDIFGRIIGTSQARSWAVYGTAFNDFSFAPAVPLSPGNMYVFEVRDSGSTLPFGLRYEPGDEYARGKAILAGNTVNADLVFRVGTTVPEPNAVFLLGLGGALGLLKTMSSGRKNRN
jgi:hypothetical protein